MNKTTDGKRTRRKLISFSNYSICVTLPKKALEQLSWHKGTEIVVEVNLDHRSMTLSKPGATASINEVKTEPGAVVLPYHAIKEPLQPDQASASVAESLRW